MTSALRKKMKIPFGGTACKEYRESIASLSLRGFAEKSGLEASKVSRMENGELNTTLETLEVYSETLNVPLGDFLAKAHSYYMAYLRELYRNEPSVLSALEVINGFSDSEIRR